jgi:hypothetical protein
MDKIIDYLIIEETDKKRLEKKVLEFINKHKYTLHGGLSVYFDERGGSAHYIQTMILFESNNK